MNLKGVFLCLKYEISQMQKQDKATHYSIVNVSSIAGLMGKPSSSFSSLLSLSFLHLSCSSLLPSFILFYLTSFHFFLFNLCKGFRMNSPYAAVKHGVIGMTKSTAVEVCRPLYYFLTFTSLRSLLPLFSLLSYLLSFSFLIFLVLQGRDQDQRCVSGFHCHSHVCYCC